MPNYRQILSAGLAAAMGVMPAKAGPTSGQAQQNQSQIQADNAATLAEVRSNLAKGGPGDIAEAGADFGYLEGPNGKYISETKNKSEFLTKVAGIKGAPEAMDQIIQAQKSVIAGVASAQSQPNQTQIQADNAQTIAAIKQDLAKGSPVDIGEAGINFGSLKAPDGTYLGDIKDRASYLKTAAGIKGAPEVMDQIIQAKESTIAKTASEGQLLKDAAVPPKQLQNEKNQTLKCSFQANPTLRKVPGMGP